MNKVVLIERNPSVRELLIKMISQVYPIEVMTSAKEAINSVKNNNDFLAIVTEYETPDMNGWDLYQVIKSKGNKIPFILLTVKDIDQMMEFKDMQNDNSLNLYLKKPKGVGKLLVALRKIKEQNTKDSDEGISETSQESYSAFPLNYLMRLQQCYSDIYLKISNHKFVKVLHKNENIDFNVFSKYQSKGINQFYVLEEQYEDFVCQYLEMLNERISSDKLSEEVKVIDRARSLKLTSERMQKLGLDEKTITMAQKSIDQCLDMIDRDKSLLSELKNILNKGDYIFEHSLSISFIAGSIIKGIQAFSSIPSAREKLTMAALFHDSTLTANQAYEHDLYKSKSEIEKNLNHHQVQEIMGHPLKSSKSFLSSKSHMQDVDHIILQHHEKPDGLGYPRGLSSKNIHQLAAVFIVAEDFISRINDLGINPFAAREVIDQMKNTYNEGQFLTVYEALKSVLMGSSASSLGQ